MQKNGIYNYSAEECGDAEGRSASAWLLCLRGSSLYRYKHSSFRLLLLSGNKRGRIETITHSAEWSQFAVHYFFSIIWLFLQNYNPLKRNQA